MHASGTDTDDGAASLFLACTNPSRVSQDKRRSSIEDERSLDADSDAQSDKSSASGNKSSQSDRRSEQGKSDRDDDYDDPFQGSGWNDLDRSDEQDVSDVCDIANESASRNEALHRFRRAVQHESSRYDDDAKEYDGHSGSRTSVDVEDVYTKQSLLRDLERLRKQPGVQWTKEWCMKDDVDDMEFELKRITLHMDEGNNVGARK